MSPEQLLYCLWAKTNERDRDDDGNPPPWTRHPLPLHLLDVGLVAETWLREDPHLFRRFCALWPDADPEAVRRALVLTAAAHDVGKLYPAFQAKSPQGWAYGYGTTWSDPVPNGASFDHGAGTYRIFRTLFGGRYGAASGVDRNWKTLLPLLRVGAGHHGTLYPENDTLPDPSVRTHPLFAPLVPVLLAELVHHFGPPLPLPPEPPHAFLLLTAGFVSVADWFGSNADSFPLSPDVTDRAGAEAYLARHREARTAETALREAGLIAGFRPPEGTVEELFAALFSPDGEQWRPRPGFQAAACAIPFGRNEGPEIAVVEAPMGLGKTEIALFLATQALRHGTAAGLYAALPTQATANALFARVERYAGRIRGETDLALALAHGAKHYFRDYRALRERTRRTVFDRARRADPRDPTPPSEVVAPSWVQPSKRALLAPLGLGTIDQALLGAMGVRHGFVRLFGLARKVVVLDEVHAYDVYMGVLLEHLLAWLGALGAKVILLSATLPAGLRRRLLAAYSPPRTRSGDAAAPPEADAYPQLLHAVGDAPVIVLPDPAPETARRTDVRVEPIEAAGEADDRTAAGVAWVREKVLQGGCVAWIRNTVREAQAAFEALRAEGIEADLLHARFTRHDRNAKEETLLERFGPPAPDNPRRPAARVVVATQVIEQSVDVDFDAMLSDLAPVDLLLQRAGRLHRHDRPGRRHGHDAPVLGVLMPDAEARRRLDFGTSVYVYDADTLARSAVLVREHPVWTLPDACRTLVAELYDRNEAHWTAERLGVDPERLSTARERFKKRRDEMERAARQALFTAPDQFPVMRSPRNDRSDAGEHVALTTRYGAHSAAAVLFRETPNGPAPLGSTSPLAVPAERDWQARLAVEEALALASVSFPWYGPRPAEADPPEALAGLYRWWRETHPYDDRLFLLLEADGTFRHPSVEGAYDTTLGLTVARTKDTPPAAEDVPLEDL